MHPLRAGLAIVVTLVAAELVLRGLIAVETSDSLRRLAMRIEGGVPATSEGWAARYLRQLDSGAVPFARSPLFAPHATRGWTHAPDKSVWIEGYRYTTNAHGQRASPGVRPAENRRRILVLGDSQTFGEEVDDAFPWPTVLGRERPDLEVINLAVGGYGIDQMLLTYLEEVEAWRPDAIVLAAIPDDFYRTALWFREAPKPKFEIVDGALRQARGVLGLGDVVDELRARPGIGWRRSMVFATIVEAYEEVWARPRLTTEAAAISRGLLARLVGDAGGRGIPLVLVYIGEFHMAGGPTRPFEADWRSVCEAADPTRVYCPDWRAWASKAEGEVHGGHYRRLGHEIIASMVGRSLERLLPVADSEGGESAP